MIASPIRVYSAVRYADADILPHFLRHYRCLGVDGFKFALHGNWPSADKDLLGADQDVEIFDPPSNLHEYQSPQEQIDQMVDGQEGSWGVFVSAHDFLVLPYLSLRRTIHAMLVLGMDALPAFVVQRLAEDGELQELSADLSLDDQFPLVSFHLAEEMGAKPPIWKSRYPIALIKNGLQTQAAPYAPPNGVVSDFLPLRGSINQFIWRSTAKNIDKEILHSNDDAGVPKVYEKYLVDHNWKLPLHNAKNYSQSYLQQSGLLARPSRQQIKQASFLRRVRNGDTGAIGRYQVATHIQSHLGKWASNTDHAEILNLQNLNVEPGRICLVSFEISGPTGAGGIGTAVAATAEFLSANGHEVHVLFSPFGKNKTIEPAWTDYWLSRGVVIHCLPRIYAGENKHLSYSSFIKSITDWLRHHKFDVIHFHDNIGFGSFAAILKASGAAFLNTKILYTDHGNVIWHRRGNNLPWQPDESEKSHLVQQIHELSDLAIFPSRYLLQVMSKIYPKPDLFCLPNLLRGQIRSFASDHSEEEKVIDEIVYFGRIEARKGIGEFIDALRLIDTETRERIKFTILGRFTSPSHEENVVSQFTKIGIDVNTIRNFDNVDAVNYLKTNNCLAIIPSRFENLPYSVYECVENGIPMVATNVGGIPELLADDHENILVDANPAALAEKLQRALRVGLRPGRLAFDPFEVEIAHLALYAHFVESARLKGRAARTHSSNPVTIVYGEETGSRQFPEDGAPDCQAEGSDEAGTWVEVAYREASSAKSDRLLFKQDQLNASSDAAEILDAAMATTGADAVVSSYCVEDGDRILPVIVHAGPKSYSVAKNIFGLGLFLIKTEVFVDIGGFDPRVPSGLAHWDLLNRLHANGGHIVGIPEPLSVVENALAQEVNDPPGHEFLDILVKPWTQHQSAGMEGFTRIAAHYLARQKGEFDLTVEVASPPKKTKLHEPANPPENINLYEPDMAHQLALSILPKRLLNPKTIVQVSRSKRPWTWYAFRRPMNVPYWNTIRRLQKSMRKR